jgi:hypothetical protein
VRSAIQKAGRTPAERDAYGIRNLPPVKERKEELVLA